MELNAATPFSAIVVGYDGSRPARRALRCAARLARPGGRVTVVAVVPPLIEDARTGVIVDPRDRQQRDRRLAAACAFLRQCGVAAVRAPRQGDAAEEILLAARDAGADLVVVGRRGRGRLRTLLLGSVSTAVVEDGGRDVLVVR